MLIVRYRLCTVHSTVQVKISSLLLFPLAWDVALIWVVRLVAVA